MSELEIGKVNLVKDIIVNLARSLQDLVDGNPESHYIRLPVERFLETETTLQPVRVVIHYTTLRVDLFFSSSKR